jgi:hypothetical protein
MALGDPYATLAQLKDRLGISVSDTVDDLTLNDALDGASRGIEAECHRQFNDAGTESARVFYPISSRIVRVDDFQSSAGLLLATDPGYDGVFEQAWTASGFELRPLNGVVNGQTGWPYNKIMATPSTGLYFPCTGRASVKLTARWGWSAVPKPIKIATLILAEDLSKLKDLPFGSGGYGEWGRIKARENPNVLLRIAPYMRSPLQVA